MTAVCPDAMPPSVPLECKPRTFIFCFDDKSYNLTGKTPSNLRKLTELLPHKEDSQLVAYHVGTIFCFQCQFSYAFVALFWTFY